MYHLFKCFEDQNGWRKLLDENYRKEISYDFFAEIYLKCWILLLLLIFQSIELIVWKKTKRVSTGSVDWFIDRWESGEHIKCVIGAMLERFWSLSWRAKYRIMIEFSIHWQTGRKINNLHSLLISQPEHKMNVLHSFGLFIYSFRCTCTKSTYTTAVRHTYRA